MRAIVRALASAALVLTASSPAMAQSSGAGGDSIASQAPMIVNREIAGRVVHAQGGGLVPVPGLPITLHRVGPEGGQPIDSARTGSGGRYRFRYKATGSDEAVYFVSASWNGITYFSTPTRNPEVPPGEGDITVFDTTSTPFPIHAVGHHLVVAAPGPDGTRNIAEVYEIGNDTSVTLVAAPGSTTFTAHLPAGAVAPRVTQGDVAPATVRFVNGEMRVDAPISPGLRQVAIEYTLPASAFPLSMPLEQPTGTLEVLVEEQAARVTAPGIRRVAAVALEGRTFVRYLAQDLPGSAVLEIAPPASEAANRVKWIVALGVVAALAMIGALVFAFRRRRFGRSVQADEGPVALAPEDDAESLVRQIAMLDAEYERGTKSPEATAEHETRRAALKGRLAARLAAEHRRG